MFQSCVMWLDTAMLPSHDMVITIRPSSQFKANTWTYSYLDLVKALKTRTIWVADDIICPKTINSEQCVLNPLVFTLKRGKPPIPDMTRILVVSPGYCNVYGILYDTELRKCCFRIHLVAQYG